MSFCFFEGQPSSTPEDGHQHIAAPRAQFTPEKRRKGKTHTKKRGDPRHKQMGRKCVIKKTYRHESKGRCFWMKNQLESNILIVTEQQQKCNNITQHFKGKTIIYFKLRGVVLFTFHRWKSVCESNSFPPTQQQIRIVKNNIMSNVRH